MITFIDNHLNPLGTLRFLKLPRNIGSVSILYEYHYSYNKTKAKLRLDNGYFHVLDVSTAAMITFIDNHLNPLGTLRFLKLPIVIDVRQKKEILFV